MQAPLHWRHFWNGETFLLCRCQNLPQMTVTQIFPSPLSEIFHILSHQQTIGSKGQELCRDCAWLLKKRSLQNHGAVCARVCVCVCTRNTNRQTSRAYKSVDCVRARRCDTRWGSCSSNNVLLGTGTISALCGRTAAPLLKSQASSKPFVLLADNTAASAHNMVK